MFVVRPMDRNADVRSLLGFMSVASRWGNHLFPGITVLTRDLYAIQAMHQVAVSMRAWDRDGAARFKNRRTDQLIARQLSKNLPKSRNSRDPSQLVQVMSYWQRYGSLFVHFGLLQERSPHSVAWYRNLIFADRNGAIGEDTPRLRESRIKHFRWYRKYRRLLVADDVQHLLDGRRGRWRLWWLSGENPPSSAPRPIRLVRELEFFFTVWQTLFESAIQAYRENRQAKLKSSSFRRPIAEFVRQLAAYGSNASSDRARQMAGLCLQLHDTHVSRRLQRWHEETTEHFGQSNVFRFANLHGDRKIASLRDRSGSSLLKELGELHADYCQMQQKQYAAYVSDLSGRVQIHRAPPNLSARLDAQRWGLFGYRMEAAVGLHQTAGH